MGSERPNPGSDEAVAAGCTCAVLDNARGQGVMILGEGPFFWMETGCPLHDLPLASTNPDQTRTAEGAGDVG